MKASLVVEHGYQADETVACKNPTRVRGVLHTPDGAEHGRVVPKDAHVADYIEHFWWARWNLEEPRTTEILTYPSVHIVFEGDAARVVGVVRKKFERTLEGRGEVFGLKFRPGMFRPLWPASVHTLSDRTVALPSSLAHALAALFAPASPDARAVVAERALQQILPAPLPPAARLARDLVERIRSQESLRTVAALENVAGLSERALQRLFREQVGVSPKWVVCRFRLQEAAERLATTDASVASVAASLDYFDQAHFARDFKAVVGRTPIAFIKATRR